MFVLKKASIWLAILIPPVAFYVIVFGSLSGLPVTDDYENVLGFLLRWKTETGMFQHIAQIVTAQHNDYRLIFENAFYGVQYAVLGHTNLKWLAILGDLFVILLFGMLYLIWRDCGRPREYTILAFIPVSWILFQLQYVSDLDNASAPLQHIPVIVFALLTCFLATKRGLPAFIGALLSLLLCIASSGNGLFVIPLAALIFLQHRDYWKLLTWCLVSVMAGLIYFQRYDYTVEMSHTHMSNNVLSVIKHLSLSYAATFLGSIAAIANPLPAILFGVVLTGVFLYATYDRLYARHPAIYYSALFFFVTAIAVSGLRSSFGPVTALGSRYRINSTVLLILLYFYLMDRFYSVHVRPVVLRIGVCTLAVLLIGFTALSDRGGRKLMLTTQHKEEAGLLRWLRHEPRPAVVVSAADDYTVDNEKKGFYEPEDPILTESLREGIYKLPPLPIGN